MLKGSNRKFALVLVLSCVFCLAAGLALGFGIQTRLLSGTALPLPPLPQGISSLDEILRLETAGAKTYLDAQHALSQKMGILFQSITDADKKAKEDGQVTQAEQASMSQLMQQLQALNDQQNEMSEYINRYLASLQRIKESINTSGL